MDVKTPAVVWNEATHADRSALRTFTCTTPKPPYRPGAPSKHPKHWELVVQGWIRNLRVPIDGMVTQVGYVGSDLAAVAALSCDVTPEGPEGFIHAAAIATAHRGSKDKGLADAMMGQIELSVATHFDALGHRTARIRGKIHVSNRASQAMVKRAEWEPWLDGGDGLRNWVLNIAW